MSRLMIASMMTLLVAFSNAYAEGGLYGKTRISFGAGYLRPGDEATRAFDSIGIIYGGGIGLPMSQDLDIEVGFSHMKLSSGGVDISATDVDGTLLYHLRTGGTVEPSVFLGGTMVNAEDEAGFASEDGTEFGFIGGIGFEASISENALISGSAALSRIAGSYDVALQAGPTIWQSDPMYLHLIVGYATDKGDVIVKGGFGFTF